MVEYVYAICEYDAEHGDELALQAGEKIEVLEKDNIFGDGWWTGRNMDGREGLFPKSFVEANPPQFLQTIPISQPSGGLIIALKVKLKKVAAWLRRILSRSY